MLEFKPGARAYLSKIKALSTDKDDKDVFVGLTATESAWYAKYLKASFSGNLDRTCANQEKYLTLLDRHEKARQAIVADNDPVRTLQLAPV